MMKPLHTEHWQYLHAKPTPCGRIKAKPEDFEVNEVLGFEPSGEGEHIFLWVEKIGLNTAYVAEQIARFCRLPLRAVSYAGRKDKHALTRQWFGVHIPGKKEFDWSKMELTGFQVLKAVRHNKKLRIGVLKGNRFHIVVRDLSDTDQIEQRLAQIATLGVPNYFGEQRFGDTRRHPQGGNLALAEQMLLGTQIHNRNKRSMVISALRAWLFNEFVSERLRQSLWQSPLLGDVCLLTGSNSYFVADGDLSGISGRLKTNDISLSAPMWGVGDLASDSQAKDFELAIAGQNAEICQHLASLGLQQERRSMHLQPENLQWHLDSNRLAIEFTLPSGCFATSILREVVNAHSAEQ